MIRVTYMGTPEYAVPALNALAANDAVDVALVVTQPDRPYGRGRTLQAPPVKAAATDLGLQFLQADSLKDPKARAVLLESAPDLIIVAAFGLILGPKTLALPRLGCINLHASLLPDYRGANPIAAAIASQECETGVTLMHMDRGLDTGDIIAARPIAIETSDTTASLTQRLSALGAELLTDSLPSVIDGTAPRVPQSGPATLTRPMIKSDGWIDWQRSAGEIDAHIRSMKPWPGAWTCVDPDDRLLVHGVTVEPHQESLAPGQIRVESARVLVGTSTDAIALASSQVPGGRALSGHQLIERFRALDGRVLGAAPAPPVPGPLVRRIDASS